MNASTATWFGPDDAPLLGWLSEPGAAPSGVGVLILAPVGYEYWSSHRTLRVLAEQLADHGHLALRADYPGTGDSAGEQGMDSQVADWSSIVGAGADELRARGAERIVVVGLRLGATIALVDAATTTADLVVAWAPVTSGRRYVREIRMLGTQVPRSETPAGDADLPGDDAAIAIAGCLFSARALVDLARVAVRTIEAAPAPSVLIVDRPDRRSEPALTTRLAELGCEVDTITLDGTELCLDLPAEYAQVPAGILEAIVGRIDALPVVAGARVDTSGTETTAQVPWQATAVTETVLRVGELGLVGIAGRPDAQPLGDGRSVIVWVNSGSETHVGPGRAWVEYCRALAVRGHHTLRVDCRGWGESPDDGHAPARPYDLHMVDDLRAVVGGLRSMGYRQITLAGLCAGAWISLALARAGGVDAVVAINPQLYWQPGDPVEANIVTETHERRKDEIERIKKWRRRGLWSVLDVVGVRHPAASLLHDLERSGTRTLMLFSGPDDGLEFLDDRTGRAWRHFLRSGTGRSVQVPDIDHGMHRHWLRPRVVAEVAGFLDGLPAA